MIDDKNDQLKRKEQLIESLKKEFMRNKEDDCRQIQLLNEELRELKTRVQTASLNEIMTRPTSKNFYPSSKGEDLLELRNQLQRREEENRLLQEKYDKLFICTTNVTQPRRKRTRTSPQAANASWRGSWTSYSRNGRLRRSGISRTRNG
jgi:hypothetical protein